MRFIISMLIYLVLFAMYLYVLHTGNYSIYQKRIGRIIVSVLLLICLYWLFSGPVEGY